MIHLGRLSLAGTGIVIGGITLGSALASYADPMPKAAQPAPWEGRIHPQIAAYGAGSAYASMPEDLYPANLPSRYAPAEAYTELRVPADDPQPRYADSFGPAPATVAQASWPADADQTLAVPHYVAIERAAQAQSPAPAVNADATDGAAPAAPEPAADNYGKVIHIADQG
ncbi:MAG: hypothetical protein ABIT09_03715 [Croceibacterium sp.]